MNPLIVSHEMSSLIVSENKTYLFEKKIMHAAVLIKEKTKTKKKKKKKKG